MKKTILKRAFKKSVLKKGLSLFTAVAITVGLIGGQDLFLEKSEAAEEVEYNPQTINAYVLPNALVDNDTFMRNEVYVSSGFNVNGYFSKTGDSNIKEGAPSSLEYNKNFWHDKNDHWYADYKYSFGTGDVVNTLIDQNQLAYGYRTFVRSDYHYHLGAHSDKLWDVGIVKIFTNSSKDCSESVSGKKNDEQGQEFKGKHDISPYSTDLYFEMSHSGCNCGSSGVTQSTVYLYDRSNPHVTGAYVSSDIAGHHRIGYSGGFTVGETGYITLEFNEYIRFGNDTPQSLSLNLDLFYTGNDQSVNGDTITAKLVKLEDSKMVFSFYVPDTLNNIATDVYIKSISTNQDWVNKSSDTFPYIIKKKNGDKYTVYSYLQNYLKCSSAITDLAGNPIDWSASLKNMSINKVYLDASSPRLMKIEMEGTKIKTKGNTQQSSNPNQNTDRSSIYLGMGDSVTFKCYYSEKLSITSRLQSNIKAVLNVKKENDSIVKLGVKSVEHVPGKSIFGTDYSSVDVTVITFDTFIVTSGMKTIMPEDNLGEEMSVYITGFEGMYGAGVTDMRGNGILEYDTSIKPAQQEFIDAMKPNLTTSLTYNSTKKKYWASVSGEWMFTVPFTVEEPADVANGVYSSGLDGKQGTFSFFMNDEKSHPFQWYIDDNPGCQSDSTRWKNARTAYGTYSEEYKNQFAETEGTSYLHIKVIEDEAYPYEDISYICGDITFELTDWAGNSSTTKIPICYNADTVAPAIEVISYRVTLDDIATNTATMHIKLRLSDSFGLGSTGSYSYQSNDNNPSESVRQDFDIVEGSREQIIDFDLPFTMGSTDYYKDYTRFVYFSVTDKVGHLTNLGCPISYKIRSIESDYVINTRGTEDKPLGGDELNIFIHKPKDVSLDSDVGIMPANTMMLIPYGTYEAEDGTVKDRYLAFLKDSEENQDTNIFENIISDGLYNYNYPFIKQWYVLAGQINEDNSGTFEVLNTFSTSTISDIGRYINTIYGKEEFIFVSSTEISSSDFSFSGDESITKIEREEFYLVSATEYSASFEGVINSKEESIEENICIGKESTSISKVNPVESMKEVFVKFKMWNVSDESSNVKYGCSRIDTEKSTYVLTEVNASKSDANKFSYTGQLEANAEQLLVFPVDVKETGVYKLQVNIVTVEGLQYSFEPDYYLYVDQSSFNAAPAEYNKSYYVEECEAKMLSGVDHRQITSTSQAIPVGFFEDPENGLIGDIREKINADNRLSFSKEITGEIDANSGYTVEDRWEIRAWSVEDKDGETNAKWYNLKTPSYVLSLGSTWEEAEEYFSYQLLLVDTFSADSYNMITSADGAVSFPTLPVVIGDNQIHYEVRKEGGKSISGTLVLRASESTSEISFTEWERRLNYLSVRVNYSQDLLDNGGIQYYRHGKDGGIQASEINSYSASDMLYFNDDITFYGWTANAFGNISTTVYEATGLDSTPPQHELTELQSDIKNNGFHFLVHVTDNKNLKPDGVYITYDRPYTANLQNREEVEDGWLIAGLQFNVPVNMEGDGIWESYENNVNGVYRTKVSNYTNSETGSSYDLEIWGEFKYNPKKAIGEEIETSLEVFMYDEAGNSCYPSYYRVTYKNEKPTILVDGLTAEGYPKFTCYNQLETLKGFGQTILERTVVEPNGYINCSAVCPMICTDGVYTFKYTDLFGTVYEENIAVDLFDTSDIKIQFSETEKTNQNVTVAIETINEGDSVTSISGSYNDENGNPVNVAGEINRTDATKASIEMPYNGTITVTTGFGKTHVIRVANIDKTLEDASIVFSYNGSPEPIVSQTEIDTILSEATAIVVCGEEIDGVNGKLSYTFPYGSNKGDTYTFEYVDEAGNTGSITATLPYNLRKAQEDIPTVDDKAPDCDIYLSGMRFDKYMYLGDFFESNTGSEISTAAAEYIAQSYALRLAITDDSNTKVILKTEGSEEVITYESGSDTINNVTYNTNDKTIYVSDNASFDLYIVDEYNNISAIKGFSFSSVVNQAPKVNVVYEPISTAAGYLGVRAWFDSNLQKISFFDTTLNAVVVQDENGEQILKYYKDYEDNTKEKFYYKDIYGNIGNVTVNIQALDTETPIVTSVSWLGIGVKLSPSEVQKKLGNDIIANLKCSKYVCQVNVYEYDENATDKLGALITADVPVKTSFTGKNVYVTYCDNVDRPLVVEIVASGNGRKTTKVLPEVTCLDKANPVVTITKEELSSDKLSKIIEFTTDEPTQFSGKYTKGYATSHQFIANANKEYELMFTDASGNITTTTITVTDIDDVKLNIQFSRDVDGAQTFDSTADMNIVEGETIYVMANKKAKITIEGLQIDMNPEEWTPVTFNYNAGLYILKAEDAVTKATVHEIVYIREQDVVAPVISFDNASIKMYEDMTMDEMNELLHTGVSIYDNQDGVITDYEILNSPESVKHGYYFVTYQASDSSGNVATVSRKLYIAYKDEPSIRVNGIEALPYSITFIDAGDMKVELNDIEESGLVIKYDVGMYTTGQMKYSKTTVANGDVISTQENRYYTIYLRTKERKEYIFYVYAD